MARDGGSLERESSRPRALEVFINSSPGFRRHTQPRFQQTAANLFCYGPCAEVVSVQITSYPTP